MRFKARGIIGALVAVCAFAACEEDVPKENPDAVKETTYLLYMVGQNDLKVFLNENIDDLKKGYAKSDVDANLLVYADISSTPTLFLIGKDENGDVVQNTVQTYSDRYSIDPDVMREVINDVFTRYPARRLGVTFSSHADGSLYTPDTVKKRSFGYEGEEHYSMNITDMREVLEGCPYLDMVMFDACLMANVETAYELKERAHYFLSAPNSIPAEGFPYDRALPYLLRMDAEGLTEAARTYMDYYRTNSEEWDDFVSISLTDLSRMGDLAACMDSLFRDTAVCARMWELDRNTLQSFETGYELYDYGDWVDSAGRANPYVARVRSILERAVVYKDHGSFSSVNDYTTQLIIPIKEGAFSGLNTYVPRRPSRSSDDEGEMMRFFTSLKWYRDAGLWRVPLYNRYEGGKASPVARRPRKGLLRVTGTGQEKRNHV